MKILNDKYGLSYLSGNAQILFANTGSTQQFDTIVANTFTNLGNSFTINTAGVYGANLVTTANVSGANIIISGNLYLGTASGNTGQYIQKSATGIAWVDTNFTGGAVNTVVAANLSTANAQITGGNAALTTLFSSNIGTANASITAGTATTLLVTNFSSGNTQITGGNATLTTFFASNISSGNVSMTGGNIGMNYNKVVSLIGNVYTGNLFAGNLSSSNVTISGGYISAMSNITVNNFTYANSIIEPVAIHAGTAPTGEMPINLLSNSTHYYGATPTGNWTPNVRASASVPLNSYMAIGQQITFSMILLQGATPRNNSSGNLRIDNTWVTARWPGATTPTAVSSRTEVYTYTLIKTANATWVAIGSSSSHG